MPLSHQNTPVPAMDRAPSPATADEVHPLVERSDTASPETLTRDLKTLARFIDIYCKHKHPDAEKESVSVPGFDLDRLAKPGLTLCADCRKLLAHAFVKRSHCPMHPKPACKHCPSHCYHPRYRAAIREVMKFSGRHLVLTGRIDYLAHLLF